MCEVRGEGQTRGTGTSAASLCCCVRRIGLCLFLSKHTFGNLVTFALDPTFPFAAVGEFRGVFLRLLLPLDAREAAFFGLTIGSPSCCSRAGRCFASQMA